ncbi:unnamed protein product [Ectocarpus sp. CCAP 1310/34]|nr:unnamed protein product [Ectocarpus sp. CCAP 1310/34]
MPNNNGYGPQTSQAEDGRGDSEGRQQLGSEGGGIGGYGETGAAVSLGLKETPSDQVSTPRGRSKSLNVKGADNVLVPEVGTASYHVALASGSGEAAADDLYMEGISLRRGFAAEFISHLEDDARNLFLFDDDDFAEDSETAPLWPDKGRGGGKGKPRLERKVSSRSQAAVSRVVVTFLKSMVGSYILYTPKMFQNGGLTASILSLLCAAWVACDNMIVLIRVAEKTGKNSYGQLGYAVFGKVGQLLVDVSLVLSQLSFCSSYFIFIVLNIPSALPVPPPGSRMEYLLSPNALVAMQLLVYIPMAWIRHLKYLALAMFGANVCMWLGLILIVGIDAELLIREGPEPVLQYNPDTFIIFLGAVVVCFEGIGLVLPLRDSMEPHMQHKFPGVIRVAMLFLSIVFCLFGCLGYMAYGESIETFVTMNIPAGHPVGALSVGLYSIAIMMSYPLQLFPAVKCLEGHLFGAVRQRSLLRKWLKNTLRAAVVLATAAFAMFVGPSFDNFAGLVGGLCAVPLALVYPSALQLKMMGDSMTMPERAWAWTVLVLGTFGAVLCSWQSIATWK